MITRLSLVHIASFVKIEVKTKAYLIKPNIHFGREKKNQTLVSNCDKIPTHGSTIQMRTSQASFPLEW